MCIEGGCTRRGCIKSTYIEATCIGDGCIRNAYVRNASTVKGMGIYLYLSQILKLKQYSSTLETRWEAC